MTDKPESAFIPLSPEAMRGAQKSAAQMMKTGFFEDVDKADPDIQAYFREAWPYAKAWFERARIEFDKVR